MNLSRYVVLWGIGALHLWVAWGMVYHPAAVQVTWLSGVLHFDPGVVAAVGLCALAGPIVERRWTVVGLALSSVQQWFVFLHARAVVGVVESGQYPNGYVPDPDPHWFIAYDQAIWVLVALVHVLALFNGYIVHGAVVAFSGAWTRTRP